MTFTEAREKLGNRGSKKVANNTYLHAVTDVNGNKGIAVRFHNTDVVVFYEDRTEVYSGGWQTVTTKARINEFLPAGGISQKAGVWYWNTSDPVEFEEGDYIVQLAGCYRYAVCDKCGTKGTFAQ